MSHPAPFPERLQKAFGPNPRGVVGVVDELLALCREQSLKLAWADGACRIRPLGPVKDGGRPIIVRGPAPVLAVPLPKSVFRAVLARLAALCNEAQPDGVSPYGGASEMALAGDPPSAFSVVFTNTAAKQEVVVRYKGESANPVTSPGSA